MSEKQISRENDCINKAINESKLMKEVYDKERTFNNFNELLPRKNLFQCPSFWKVIKKCILFVNLCNSEESVTLNYSVSIN